ncbi:MAG: hypothetical protein JWL84_2464 [Rhodospirillales bacterium]|nr:hypothetical protein [Rhodospirillales bacterium]
MTWLQTRSARAAIRLFALWMGLFWSGLPQALAQQSADEQQRAARAVGQLQNSLLAIEDAQRQAPRDHWDPQYVVDTVGIDARDLFVWVRQEVRWVPYRGVLRGPVGVLMDRNGNSLDQSLLLAALLHAAGHEVRLAHAELPYDIAATVWGRLADASAATALATASPTNDQPPVVTQVSDPGVAATADLYGFDAAGAAQSVDDSARTAATLVGRLDERVVKQSLRLLGMLNLPPAGQTKNAGDAAAFDDLSDHWWVQIRQASAWIDLDLLNASGEIGEALTAARETMTPEALPPAETHRVVMRIVAEQLKAGKTQEHTILEHELKPAELIGERITLRHFPMLWPADFQAVTPEDVHTRMFAALATQTEWMPVLDVGESHFKQASIRDTGVVNPKPEPPNNPFLNIGASSAGSAAAAADVLAGGNLVASNSRVSEPQPARADGELTAEWIEYEIQLPGAPPETLRREVFDILGASARSSGTPAGFQLTPEKALARSMAMLTETELLVLPCELAAEFVLEMASRTALANRDFATDLTSDPFGKTPANSSEIVAKMAPLPGPAYGLASLRFDNRLDPGTVFVNRPTILAQHAILTSAGPGALAVKIALDIVAHPVGVDPFTNIDPPFARIIQGVSDSNAEALTLPDADKVRGNTADAFDKADASDWSILSPGEEAEVVKLGLDPDIAARLVADLRQGNLVVAGKTSGTGGWWRINPTTGETLGMGHNGWGQAMVEYAFVLIFQMYLAQIACLVQANIMGKIEGTINTAAEAHANVRKNFNHCLTFAFLGVLNGMTTAYFMNRLQPGGSTPSASSPSPSSQGFNKTQKMPDRPRTPAPGPGYTQPTPGTSPPPGTRPPGPRQPDIGLDKTQRPPRPYQPSAAPQSSKDKIEAVNQAPNKGLDNRPRSLPEIEQAKADANAAADRFAAKDRIAQQLENGEKTLTPSQAEAARQARAEAEQARVDAHTAELQAGHMKLMSPDFARNFGKGAAPPSPAPPSPAPSPLAVSGIGGVNAAAGGKP